MSDIRKGQVFLSTIWETDLNFVIIRHRRANSHKKEEHKMLKNVGGYQQNIPVMDITYDSSFWFPDFDYWWVLFITNDWRIYTIKDNFSCNISNLDKARVDIVISSITTLMYVNFSWSSGCTQSIYELGS
ncbi:hypothetical protein [Xenorhabdus hominickii]|uniref:Uncharacterized protein n=1 Tax=Xenorhabdus hominickii TaxID=351679 RepID=A0A2G0Q6B0_XENHO|nr:hypothetical protein [Xenorhabdus hominickii]AOM39466.1 hypothetical protein A9255_01925 [Xenorhabdus hominickii]PHM54768.1 hypothetical protein Xhom_02724 [Xenorhabdus hominickii]